MYLFVNYRTRNEQSGYPIRFRYLLPMVRMKYMIYLLNYLRVNHVMDYDKNWLIDVHTSKAIIEQTKAAYAMLVEERGI